MRFAKVRRIFGDDDIIQFMNSCLACCSIIFHLAVRCKMVLCWDPLFSSG